MAVHGGRFFCTRRFLFLRPRPSPPLTHALNGCIADFIASMRRSRLFWAGWDDATSGDTSWHRARDCLGPQSPPRHCGREVALTSALRGCMFISSHKRFGQPQWSRPGIDFSANSPWGTNDFHRGLAVVEVGPAVHDSLRSPRNGDRLSMPSSP